MPVIQEFWFYLTALEKTVIRFCAYNRTNRTRDKLIRREVMVSRRKILKSTSMFMLLPVVNLISKESMAASNVDLKDPSVVALKYVEKASDAQRTEKMGTAASDQFCDNCRFYAIDNNDQARGACVLFRNQSVAGKGWCAGWVPTS
ncbi:MAG: hypothetical protein ACI9VI_002483 [Candidatus Azotimanducaceae bacterium]